MWENVCGEHENTKCKLLNLGDESALKLTCGGGVQLIVTPWTIAPGFPVLHSPGVCSKACPMSR